MADYSPNPRVRQAQRKGDRVHEVTTIPKSGKPDALVHLPRPMPGVIILVHGVNDVGEAYATQAKGLCDGLNLRLGRKDLTPGDWDIPKACGDNYRAGYHRRADAQGYNPIIPFYWGYRPVDKATYEADQARYREELRKRGAVGAEAPYDAYYIDGSKDPAKGFQNLDCFNNRLDEHFAKNGGVFANATNNLVDMWGPGGDILGVVKWISRKLGDDLSHVLYENPHRIYFVLAAQRLANLIVKIRRGSPQTKDDSINLIAHSQGTLVSLLANFLVAQSDERPADCLILNHSTYCLTTPILESVQSFGPQQSRQARLETLANLCKLIDAQRLPGPSADKLAAKGIASREAAGKPLHVHDNHGKVFNYFCPHDMTVSLKNVEGIGWQGVSPEDASRLGRAFVQRIFLNDRPLHAAPGPMRLPDLKRDVGKLASNRDLPNSAVRDINAPALPDFGYTFALQTGCETMGNSDWGVHSAAVAIEGENLVSEVISDPFGFLVPLHPSRALPPAELARLEAALKQRGKQWHLARASRTGSNLTVVRYLSAEELQEQAGKTSTEDSHHSAIVLDPKACQYVTAFDLAIGRCKSYDFQKIDGGPFWQELLRIADWRFSKEPNDVEYYGKGILPFGIKKQMNKPPAIPGLVSETVAGPTWAAERQRIEKEIEAHRKCRNSWPKLEWEAKQRRLESQHASIAHRLETDSRYPVAHTK